MKNIIKDINEYKQFGFDYMLNKLETERYEIIKNLHIITIMHFIALFEDVCIEKEKEGISYITLRNQYEPDIGDTISMNYLDENHQNINKYLINKQVEKHRLEGKDFKKSSYYLFYNFVKTIIIEAPFVGELFEDSSPKEFKVDKSSIVGIKALLLSKEIEIELTHTILEHDLSNKNDNNINKKIKI